MITYLKHVPFFSIIKYDTQVIIQQIHQLFLPEEKEN